MLKVVYNKLMDNKERVSQGGENGNEWEGLSEVEFSAEKAAERAAEGSKEKSAAEKDKTEKKPAAKERGKVEPSLKEQFKAVERENHDIVHPKVIEFLSGKEPKLAEGENPSDYLVYNISSDKRGAVRRELAGQAFEEQVFNAQTFNDFRAANLLAGEIEADETIDPAIKERLSEYKSDPASGYAEKKAFFDVELTEKMIKNDEATLKLAQEQYDQAREGGFFKRLLNRRDIKQKKERVAWTEDRIAKEQASLMRQKVAFVEANAAKKAALEAKAA